MSRMDKSRDYMFYVNSKAQSIVQYWVFCFYWHWLLHFFSESPHSTAAWNHKKRLSKVEIAAQIQPATR